MVRGVAAVVTVIVAIARRAGFETTLYRVLTRPMAARYTAPAFGAYRPDEHDVIVSTYAKSGTNWMLQITQQIAWRGAATFDHIHDVVAWPDSPPDTAIDLADAAAAVSAPTRLRVIKTHLPVAAVPLVPTARYISVIRDPKDIFVSSWHFFRGIAAGSLMPSPATWLDLFCSRDCPIGSWPEHVAGWWALRDADNVLVIGYGELTDDLDLGVDRVAAHLGVDLDDGEHAQVVERSSFAFMRAIDGSFNTGPMTPLGDDATRMMRRGQRGSASELLDAVGRARIDRWCRSELLRLGSDLPYEELFGATGNGRSAGVANV